MSRRITFFVLAASAALIATQAAADPECFGDSCRLPEVVEPPAQAAPEPVVEESVAPQASARAPAVVQKLAPSSVLPQLAAEPVAHRPAAVPSGPVERLVIHPREPRQIEPRQVESRNAEEPRPASHGSNYARAERVAQSEPGYVLGYPFTAGAVVVAPTIIYGVRPIYMFAPNAKIITVDSDD
jgi:hypothetical protein